MARSVFPHLSGTGKGALLWRRTPTCWELGKGWEAACAHKGRMAGSMSVARCITPPGSVLLHICQAPSHRSLHLRDKVGIPVRVCPAASQMKHASQLELILLSPELPDLKVKSE